MNLTPLVSASQITSFRDCPRQWGFRSILKVKSPQTPAQVLGVDVDEGQLQPYLRDGRPFDFTRPSGEIAAAAVPHLPAPRTAKAQVEILFPALCSEPGKLAPFAYIGYLDILEEDPWRITDIKTTRDFRWAKTEADLRRDPQAIIYATWAIYRTKNPSSHMRWLYLRTLGRSSSHVVDLEFQASDPAFEAEMLAIEETAKKIVHLKQVTDKTEEGVNGLEANTDTCANWGGCPHWRVRCQLTEDQRWSAHFKGSTHMGLLDLIGAKGPTTTAPPPEPTSGVGASVPATGLLARLAQGRLEEPLPAWATAPVDPMAKARVEVNPPERELPAPVVAPTVASVPAEPTKRTRATKAEMEARRAASGAPAVPSLPASAELIDALEDLGEAFLAVSKALRGPGAT